MNRSPLRRSAHAQLKAMQKLWPDFKGQRLESGVLLWQGPLKPKAKVYDIAVLWKPGDMERPYVFLLDPALQPRDGATFEDVPHLIFNEETPERSGFCLFDPDGNEWTDGNLIAETTIYWASEWLAYYELWHLTGKWLGPSVGYESVAQIKAAEADLIQEHLADVH